MDYKEGYRYGIYMEAVEVKWEEILLTLKTEFDLSDLAFKSWIAPLKIDHIENGTLYIPCEEQITASYIAKKYSKPLSVVIEELTGKSYEIIFMETEQLKKMKPKTARTMTSTEVLDRSGLNINYTFDRFVVGGNNRFAHSASLAVAESPGDTYNPLYIYGGPGLGKTHLMHSIGNFILEQNPDARVLYVTSEVFTNEVIDSIRSGNANAMTRLREKYRTVDVLMIDDVQFIIGKESTQEEFFHTFNVLHSAGKQIILSSDKPPKEMETLDERFRSRFEWGLIADIQPPDYETRMAILKKNAENDNKNIKEEVFDYIATNIKSNIRELEGAYNKVIAFSRLNKVEITLDNIEEALKDIISPNAKKKITPQYIIGIVAEHFSISPEEIVSKRRNSELVQPRQICMYLCRHLTEESLQGIAQALGKKDHTTVIHGIEKITYEITVNEELKNRIDIIMKKINPD